MTTSEYKIYTSNVPPSLKERDGKWFIEIYMGDNTYEAQIGFWLLRQLFERMVIPAILKRD